LISRQGEEALCRAKARLELLRLDCEPKKGMGFYVNN